MKHHRMSADAQEGGTESQRKEVGFEVPRAKPRMHFHSVSMNNTALSAPLRSGGPEAPTQKRPEWKTTLAVLCTTGGVWVICSILDFWLTPRPVDGPHLFTNTTVITATYQWCMVAYFCNLLFTVPKLSFELDDSKLMLHLLISYISVLASGSYVMLWTGFSPILVDVNSCLYIPQRWLLYCFTAPAIITILAKISNYTNRQLVWVIFIFEVMLITGGIATIPWLSWNEKVFWYIITNLPFPEILLHMWRMVTSAINEADPSSVRFLLFMAVFTEVTWIIFPIVYYSSIAGMPLYLSEPLWSLTDWLTKFVFASSLMEANFFTLAQRRAQTMKRVEEGHRSTTILQLTKAIERKDDFMSTMSHELRTPLNGIIGLSESLLEGSVGTMSSKAHQTVKVVVLSAKRLLQLINDLLDSAKLKQGTMVIKHEKVNIRSIVTDVLDLCSPLIKKGVRLVNMVGNNIPKIVGDNGRIVQILYNLVGNAAKFTDTGTVSVTSGVSEGGDSIYISVTDSGEGIPAEKLENIFVAFEQVDMSTTRRHGGTGLGLHLVKELVKAHNGEITVQSALKKGSTFTVWLPMTQSGDPNLAFETELALAGADTDEEDFLMADIFNSNQSLLEMSETNVSPVKSGGKNLVNTKGAYKTIKPFYREANGGCMVLSVDDDPINQMVVDNLLAPEGYVIQQAMNGTAALKFLDECEFLPDVILLDVMMPDISGYEVCLEIRRRFSAVHIPIIMVSAKGNPEHVMKGLESGSVDYVKKPFHRKELLSRVRAQIRNREVFEAEIASRKVNDALKRMMPLSVIQRLQQGQSMIADSHEEVSVLFIDMHTFWNHNEKSAENTGDIITIMNQIFASFERLLNKHKVYRVEHTGDSYMAVSGHDGTVDHTKRLTCLAQDMLNLTQNMKFPNGDRICIKIGIHCGPAYAGVVGLDAPRYCVFGDTVSIASRLESTTYGQTAQVSESVAAKDKSLFVPYLSALDAGTQTLATYILKCGDYEEALSDLQKNGPSVKVFPPTAAGEGVSPAELAAAKAETARAAEEASKLRSELESIRANRILSNERLEQAETDRISVDRLEGKLKEARKQEDSMRLRASVAEASEAKERDLRQLEARATEAQLAELNSRVHAAQMAEAQAKEDALVWRKKQEKTSQSQSQSREWREGLDGASASEAAHDPSSSTAPAPAAGMQQKAQGIAEYYDRDNRAFSIENESGGRMMGDAYSDAAMSARSVVANRLVDDFLNSDYTIDAFFKDLGLSQYAKVMREQNITPILLAGMSNQDLLELGVDTVGARQRILEAAKHYRVRMESATRMLLIYKDTGSGSYGGF